ncbi:DUF1667 domain-containing protein [Gudongella sp. DL1XJH-153]|uniref:DUF1667 domain-containing protein n=1 Tax=Gudongella sp. DL1XJH-153 TaxID=3409804 RepID=UPI003BB4F8FA
MNSKITCSICEMACEITIEQYENSTIISGNRCGRGSQLAEKHLTNNQKIVTGRCLLSGGQMSRLPVSTTKEIPTELIDKVLKTIQKTAVDAPVVRGQIIIRNILNTGADVIAQRKAL